MKSIHLIVVMLLQSTLVYSQTRKVESFTLKTQYDKIYSYKPGEKIILVFSDKESSKQAKEWVGNIKKEIVNIPIISIACVGSVPFFVKGMVRSAFKEKPPIYIDWGNDVAEKFSYTDGKCMLVYIDEKGVIKATVKGEFKTHAYTKFVNAITN